jgi:hypothetical protein
LEQFLKFAFGVLERRNDRKSADSPMELLKNEFTGGVKPAIKKNSAKKGFKGICERGGTISATVKFFASAQNEMFAQAKVASMFGEGAAIDKFGASFREGAFAERGEILVEFASQNELEDGVTEEFEALIGLDGNALFVGNRGVS